MVLGINRRPELSLVQKHDVHMDEDAISQVIGFVRKDNLMQAKSN